MRPVTWSIKHQMALSGNCTTTVVIIMVMYSADSLDGSVASQCLMTDDSVQHKH